MRKIVLFMVFFLATIAIQSKKIGTLSGLINPYSIEIDKSKIYIVEGPKVYIYSLKDLKLIKKFGKKGEGPKEFNVAPMTNMGNIDIQIYEDIILVNSLGKVSFFSKDGVFKNEIRAAGRWRSFKKAGDKYVGFGGIDRVENIRSIMLSIYDSKVRNGKNFFKQQVFFNPGEVNPFFMPGPAFFTNNNKIYIEKDKNIIQVFNLKGEKISSIDINKGYKKIKVTEEYKKRFLKYFKSEPAFNVLYERIKRDIKLFKYLPGIYNFLLSDKKLYVLRWNDGSDNREIAVFDLKGNLLKNTNISFFMKDLMIPYAYTIKNGVIYQLIENEDDEGVWELFATDIK